MCKGLGVRGRRGLQGLASEAGCRGREGRGAEKIISRQSLARHPGKAARTAVMGSAGVAGARGREWAAGTRRLLGVEEGQARALLRLVFAGDAHSNVCHLIPRVVHPSRVLHNHGAVLALLLAMTDCAGPLGYWLWCCCAAAAGAGAVPAPGVAGVTVEHTAHLTDCAAGRAGAACEQAEAAPECPPALPCLCPAFSAPLHRMHTPG